MTAKEKAAPYNGTANFEDHQEMSTVTREGAHQNVEAATAPSSPEGLQVHFLPSVGQKSEASTPMSPTPRASATHLSACPSKG